TRDSRVRRFMPGVSRCRIPPPGSRSNSKRRYLRTCELRRVYNRSPTAPSNRTLAPRTVAPSYSERSKFHVVEQPEVSPHLWNQILDERQMVSIELVGDVLQAGRERVRHGALAERVRRVHASELVAVGRRLG